MKTKIAIEIHSDASGFLLILADLIGKHNCGKMELTTSDIATLIKMEKLKYPSSNKFLSVINEYEDALSLTETEDLIPFCSLIWKEVHELNTISEQEIVNC